MGFERINLRYQDFLTLFKETNAKVMIRFEGIDGERCQI